MITHNQILKVLKDITTAHLQMHTFNVGELSEIATSGTVNYPLLWVMKQPGTMKMNEYQASYALLFMDLVHKDKRDVEEVISDMEQVSLDYLSQLSHPSYGFNFKHEGVQLKPFEERFNDWVAGIEMNINFELEFETDRCQIPATTITITDGI